MSSDSPEHHQKRSEFIRKLVQQRPASAAIHNGAQSVPRTIVQFWHDLQELPDDVKGCIASWARWEAKGFAHRLFDETSAKDFINRALGSLYVQAFERCYHPAMQADYFRLCYLFTEGGCYVDTDDVCLATNISFLFGDGKLKLQPLCYDTSSNLMVSPSIFLRHDANASSWIFYFNNNPLIARKGHPIIERALARATQLLQIAGDDTFPEIQSTTGPGNLSKTIFEIGTDFDGIENDLLVLRDWDSIAVSQWPLSYRNDARNWRLSNQKAFRER